ncbi:MAG: M1 family metallopeptidase, partial [Actinomycetota bacterium]|nr:M1 family metallopeptidase [Actinomycetota bacterium]
MLAEARKVLASRPGLWAAAGGCSLLVAVPQVVLATVGAAGGVAFLLTGDAGLSFEIWERAPGVSTATVTAAIVVAIAGFLAWARLYSAAVALSRPEGAPDAREAWSLSTGRWRTAALLTVQAYGAVAAAAVGLFLVAATAAGGATFGTLILLGAALLAIARTVLRIYLTIALRAAVLDGLASRPAWETAVRFVRAKRHEVSVAWVGLLAIGLTVWLTGRLITPALQETAFDYPSAGGYELARQIVQLVVAVPLEAGLMAFSIAAWTGVYDGIEARAGAAPARREPGVDPWVRKMLAGLVVVALAGNGLPTIIDQRFTSAREDGERAVAATEISPEEVVESPAVARLGRRTSYRVDASLHEEDLSWVTTIDYVNATGETLTDVGVNVYPYAYARPLRDLPLAADLLRSDFNGVFQAKARNGEVRALDVAVEGRPVDAEVDGTALTIPLDRGLRAGARVEIRIGLEMELPVFPERFGRWNDLTLLGNWIPVVGEREDGGWRLDRFGPVGDPFFSSAADYRVSIAVDEEESVVGTGTLTAIASGPRDVRTWTFEAAGVRDAAFVAGPFLRGLEGSAGDTVVRSWYPADRRRAGAANLDAAVSAIAHYSASFGALPWPDVDVIETGGRLGGMEYPGAVFVSSGSEPLSGLPLLPDLVAYSGFDEARSRYVVGHELAHQWWYGSVGSDQIRHPWLDEGFAEISTRLWLDAAGAGNDDGELTWLMTNLVADAVPARESVTAGVDDFVSNEAYTRTVYVGGSEVLMELRTAVGAETFEEVLREWHARHSLEIASPEDFHRVVRGVAGAAADPWLERFLSTG